MSTAASAFVDSAVIEVSSGRGGDGASHFRREKYHPRGGPDGGDGGRGGDVWLVVDPDLRTLVDFRYRRTFKGGDGQAGSGNDRTGASGPAVEVPVPAGTLVYDDPSGRLIADLAEPGQRFRACEGGRGGYGNAHYVSAANQAPERRELGEPAETATLRLELKLLADAALVGYPNAGKSTLIAALSSARPKIADYPFTTLTPNLGVVRLDDGASFVVADLPGLIEGAAEGRGLGHEFLRHLERARVLVHLLDMSGFERPDPVADYRTLRAELLAYDARLADLPEIVVASKMDLVDDADLVGLVAAELEADGVRKIWPISAATGQGLADLRAELQRSIAEAEVESVVARQAEAESTDEPEELDAPKFRVLEDPDELVYVVEGPEIERLVAMCDLDNSESLMALHRQLVKRGVIGALRAAGCEDGDVVRIGTAYLDFTE